MTTSKEPTLERVDEQPRVRTGLAARTGLAVRTGLRAGASSIQKKHDDTTKAIIDKLG